MGVEGQHALLVHKLLQLAPLPFILCFLHLPSIVGAFLYHSSYLLSAFLSCPDPSCQDDGCFTMPWEFTGVSLEHVIC